MPELTRLRLPDGDVAWYALDRVVDRPLGCHNCNRRIEPGETHARRHEDGRRLCHRCVDACFVGERRSASETNRLDRETKTQRAIENGAQTLLDGLEVGSFSELKRLVDVARALESGRDPFISGQRYAQMHPMNGRPILVVSVVAEDVELAEADEEVAASFARMAVRQINHDRGGTQDGA